MNLFFRIYKDGKLHSNVEKSAQGGLIIGSSKSCQISLEGLEPQHAKIEVKEGACFLSALTSQGVVVNGSKVSESWLQEGDFVEIKNFRLQFFQKNEAEVSSKSSSGGAHKKALTQGSPEAVFKSLSMGSGSDLEALVCWDDRVVRTHHIGKQGKLVIGKKGVVDIPSLDMDRHMLLSARKGKYAVQVPFGGKAFERNKGGISQIDTERFWISEGRTYQVNLGHLNIFFRRTPPKHRLLLGSVLNFNPFEKISLLASVIIVALLAILFAAMTPSEEEMKEILKSKRVSEIAIQLQQKVPTPKVIKKEKKVVRVAKPKPPKKIKKRKKPKPKKVVKKKPPKKPKPKRW